MFRSTGNGCSWGAVTSHHRFTGSGPAKIRMAGHQAAQLFLICYRYRISHNEWASHARPTTTGNAGASELKEEVLSLPGHFVHFLSSLPMVACNFMELIQLVVEVHVLKFNFLRTTASVWCMFFLVRLCAVKFTLTRAWMSPEWLILQCLALSLSPCVFPHGVVHRCSFAKRIWTTTTLLVA